MGKTHDWFGTIPDAEQVVAWLRDAGGVPVPSSALADKLEPDGREVIFQCPEIGGIEFWPEKIRVADYEENSPRWRRALLTKFEQEREPARRQIDADKSAVAGLQLPALRDDRYWAAGQVWFPTSRLKETFPDLNRICGRLERYFKKHPIVFDNTKGADSGKFGYQLCMSGIVKRVVALPEAFRLLEKGGFMIDSQISSKQYAEFRRRLQLSGHES